MSIPKIKWKLNEIWISFVADRLARYRRGGDTDLVVEQGACRLKSRAHLFDPHQEPRAFFLDHNLVFAVTLFGDYQRTFAVAVNGFQAALRGAVVAQTDDADSDRWLTAF